MTLRNPAPWVALVTALYLLVALHGVRQDLPYAHQADEQTQVINAARMVSDGSWNPMFFGHPGSTVIYPLAIIDHFWNAIAYKGTLFRTDPNLYANFEANRPSFYLIGRLLTVGYAVASVPLLYLVGRRVFTPATGLVAVILFALYADPIYWARIARTDSAAMFFILASLLGMLRYQERPARRRQLLAAVLVGLATASRYFGAALLLPLGLVEFAREARGERRWLAAFGRSVIDGGVAFLTFSAMTPYFFLDFSRAWSDLSNEARRPPDAFSPLENLLWYLGVAIPDTISWLQVFLVAVGLAAILLSRNGRAMLAALVLAIFLLVLSAPALHWHRWLVPVTPLLALLAAGGISALVAAAGQMGWLRRVTPATATVLLTVAAVAMPLGVMAQLISHDRHSSTRIRAREWAIASLPEGSNVVVEKLTPPMLEAHFTVYEESWAPPDKPLQAFVDEGYDYIFLRASNYERYRRLPEAFAEQLNFYHDLFERGCRLRVFEPASPRFDQAVTVYQLPEASQDSCDAPGS